MERLPRPILGEIMGYLEVNEVFLGFSQVNKYFHSVVSSNIYMSNYIQSYFHMAHNFSLPMPDIIEILQQEKEMLEFRGFGTTGGIEKNRSYCWVSNLYDIHTNITGYPSGFEKYNINTVGVLSDTQPGELNERTLIRIYEIFQQVGFNLSLKIVTRRPLTFDELWDCLNNHHTETALKLQDRKGEIQELYNKYKANTSLDIDKIRRYPNNDHVLVSLIDYANADSYSCIFITNEVYFSRPLSYTCPVETFMVFVSDKYIDIESQDFAFYDDLTVPEALDQLFEGNIKISPLNYKDGVYYRTFGPMDRPLKPLLWGKFEREAAEINVVLDCWFSGVYLYTKLINPDNRNEERGYFNQKFNIDANRVKLKGIVINFY